MPPAQGTLREVGGISRCPQPGWGGCAAASPGTAPCRGGPHGKRIFPGQLRYGLSSFHFPNYKT